MASSPDKQNLSDREGLSKGSKVWYKQDATTWVAAEIVKTPPSTSDAAPFTLQLVDSGKLLDKVNITALAPANPALQLGIQDLTHLSYLNEPGILHNLQFRYGRDEIYTVAGPVLIALNPCKAVPLYTQEVANQYKGGARDVANSAHLPPHIYLVAAAAFRKMVREKQSQSLIVNGESGAGKTETTKKAMQYFATLAGGTGVEDQVLETNPILEAFGNAKTLRNHNSSRFGKLIQIHFNNSHHISGALIKTYLLEKSRVVNQLPGERSYHIFYQLVRGATPEERQELGLPPAEVLAEGKGSGVTSFRFLAQSGCTDIDGVDDAEEFARVRVALADIGIDATAQAGLWRTLAGCLWLGNLEFEANKDDATNDSTKVKQNDALFWSSKLLGLTPEHLVTALTTRRIQAPGEIIIKLLNVEESRDARDALAKALYSQLFDWVVQAINVKLDTGKRNSGLSISILDIYGFEQFQRNSFEQLCINYANERLQQQFTRHLFTLEQQEYESEGIDWTKIEFTDNQECVDVIEMAPPKGLGILAILDAQCRFPKATDSTLHHKLKEALATHTHFAVNPRALQEFIVTHYAGNVTYDCTGFLDKNKDTISGDIIELLAESQAEMVSRMGRNLKEEMEKAVKRGMTVGTRFMGQLRELITGLDATGLHFVRCIKPNSTLSPGLFEPPMILHQLRCCGVLEVARVAAAGFPTRYTHTQFAQRYAILLSPEEQEQLARGDLGMQACHMLITKFGLQPGQYQLGRTKVFFRPGVLGLVEDRWAAMHKSVSLIQATWRMYVKRRDYLALRQAAVVVQAMWHARRAREELQERRTRHKAAVVIQTAWRCYTWRRWYLHLRAAAITIQVKGYRRWKFRRWLKVCMQAQEKERREREKQEMLRRLEQESFQTLRREYGVDMAGVRAALAAWASCQESGVTTLEQLNELLLAWRDGGKEAAVAAAAKQRAASLSPRESGTGEADAAAAAAAGATAVAAAANAAVAPVPAAPTAVAVDAAQAQQAAAANPSIAAAASAATIATVAAAQAAVSAAAPPTVTVPGLSRGVAISPAVANRFELAKELTIQVERLHLENIKLQKQLQLERSLKDRYMHKYEEQNVNWMDQIRVLQQYIQQVRTNVGDNHLPPMPRQVATATQPDTLRSPSMDAAAAAAAADVTANGGAGPASFALDTQDSGTDGGAGTPMGPLGAGAAADRPPLPRSSTSGRVASAVAAVDASERASRSGLPPAPSATTQTDPVPEPAPVVVEVPVVVKPEVRDTAIATDPLPPPPPPPPPPKPLMLEAGTQTSALMPASPHATPFAGSGGMAAAGGAAGAPQLQHQGAIPRGFASVPSYDDDARSVGAASASSSAALSAAAAAAGSTSGQHALAPHHSVVAPVYPAGQQAQARAAGSVAGSVPGGPQGTTPSQRYVGQLSTELDKVVQVLTDDVSFIDEVRRGATEAPGMDPGVELFKLKKKFEVWKREFKEKLKTTEEVLRKIDRMERKQQVVATANLQPSRSQPVALMPPQAQLPPHVAGAYGAVDMYGNPVVAAAAPAGGSGSGGGAVPRTTPAYSRPPPAPASNGRPAPSPEPPKSKSKFKSLFG